MIWLKLRKINFNNVIIYMIFQKLSHFAPFFVLCINEILLINTFLDWFGAWLRIYLMNICLPQRVEQIYPTWGLNNELEGLSIYNFFKWVYLIQLWSLASHSSGLTTCFSRHTSRRAPNSCFQRADNSLPTKSQMQSIHSSCSQHVQLLQNKLLYKFTLFYVRFWLSSELDHFLDQFVFPTCWQFSPNKKSDAINSQ